MANYLTSSEFTFVHPSSGLLSGCPPVSSAYNLDCHVQQNVFSPVNCTLPTTIQFPMPPVTSVPLSDSGLGSCLVDTAISSSYKVSCFPWQPGCNALTLNQQSSFYMWPEAESSTQASTNSSVPLELQSSWSEKFNSDVRPQIRCKRKAIVLSEDCLLPTKIHVNEERMSAFLNDLRLDNNNVSAQPNFENEPWYSQHVKAETRLADVGDTENLAVDSMEVNSKLGLIRNSRIELCYELELGLKTKEILPQVILDEMAKSSMQLVLWKPPEIFRSQLFGENPVIAQTQDENSNVDEDEMSNKSSVTGVDLLMHTAGQNFMSSLRWSTDQDTSVTADNVDLSDECEQMDL